MARDLKYCLECGKSKSGLPTLAEFGGGSTNTGNATVIASAIGAAKRAIYMPTRGHLCNGEHAIFAVAVGDVVVEASHHREDFSIRVWRILAIEQDGERTLARMKLEAECDQDSRGNRDGEILGWAEAAVTAAVMKALDYHCRRAYFCEQVMTGGAA